MKKSEKNLRVCCIHETIKQAREAIFELEVNAAKTKYMVMSREQTAGLSHTMKVDNSSIERVE